MNRERKQKASVGIIRLGVVGRYVVGVVFAERAAVGLILPFPRVEAAAFCMSKPVAVR